MPDTALRAGQVSQPMWPYPRQVSEQKLLFYACSICYELAAQGTMVGHEGPEFEAMEAHAEDLRGLKACVAHKANRD